QPDFYPAHLNLGSALKDLGKLAEAAAAARRATQVSPDRPEGFANLGTILDALGKYAEAAEAFGRLVQLRPDDPDAHCNLGIELGGVGRFAEALAAVRRGHELGARRPGWDRPSARWVSAAERRLELDRKLPAILKGETRPRDTVERLELVDVSIR